MAGASEGAVAALLKAGCSVLVAGDLEGASPGDLAVGAGHAKLGAQLHRHATKAAARAQPSFDRVWLDLCVGFSGKATKAAQPRPQVPYDALNIVMDCCATADGWFAAPAAAAGLGAEDGAGGAAGSGVAWRLAHPPPSWPRGCRDGNSWDDGYG